MNALAPSSTGRVRCAIYTRRSVESAYVTEFGSLENQRDMCSAYIRSQRHREWLELATRYDDDGISGSTLSRPGLQRLLADIQQGLVDNVVIYKLDRLTRSLAQFMQLVELFDKFGVTFVCVTQTFDTKDTVGRLILNILLTFAQFEREMTADRMRDRFKTLARNGQWVGGRIPLGYDLVEQRLIVNRTEAALIREIFERFVALGSYSRLAEELRDKGRRTKTWVSWKGITQGGHIMRLGTVRNVLKNRIYIGEITHKGQSYPARHEAIVPRALWDEAEAVRGRLALSRLAARKDANQLAGLLYDGIGRIMRISNPITGRKVYRYYASDPQRAASAPRARTIRVDANILEEMVRAAICVLLRDRFELSGAVLKRQRYDRDLQSLLDRGAVAARLLETLENSRLRSTYRVLLRRIEITREKVRIVLGCEELAALLAWDGFGNLRPPAHASHAQDPVHVIEFASEAVRAERIFSLPIRAREPGHRRAPNSRLVGLLVLARDIQEAIHTKREHSMREIAARLGRQPGYLARVFLLNYLAPDIQTAILDGRQPPDLTPKRLLHSRIPMDWAQQRTLFGFPAQDEPLHGPTNYARRITATVLDSID
jgi:DNA invertase Pin-like site-specific DNA recombinase